MTDGQAREKNKQKTILCSRLHRKISMLGLMKAARRRCRTRCVMLVAASDIRYWTWRRSATSQEVAVQSIITAV